METSTFEVEVYLGGLDPASVQIELYTEGQNGAPAFRQEMDLSAHPAVNSGPHSFSTRTPATRDAVDFTPRVLPSKITDKEKVPRGRLGEQHLLQKWDQQNRLPARGALVLQSPGGRQSFLDSPLFGEQLGQLLTQFFGMASL